MSHVKQIIVANVARYHSGAVPKKSQKKFGLARADLEQKSSGCAILRVATYSRGHCRRCESGSVRWTRRAIRMTAIPNPGRGFV